MPVLDRIFIFVENHLGVIIVSAAVGMFLTIYLSWPEEPYQNKNHYHAPTKIELPPHFHLEFLHGHSEFHKHIEGETL